MYENKVFLGGTCTSTESEWDWRKDLIRLLKKPVSVYDPFIRSWESDRDWDENAQKEEKTQRENCEYTLYVITSDARGIYSYCEAAVDACMKPDGKVIVAFIDYRGKFKTDIGFQKSIQAWLSLCKDHGVVVCDNLMQIASYLNNEALKNV